MSKDEEFDSTLNRPTRNAEYFAKGEDILLNPLTGWSTATLPNNDVCLIVEYLDEGPPIAARMLRLAMKRSLAAELSRALDQLARVPHVTPPEKPS